MSILISGYAKKSLAEQTGQYSYLANIYLDNTTGVATWGFSGQNGNLFGFRMESGRIYDNQNKFIYGYNNGEITSFKGIVGINNHNIYINNKIISLNEYKPVNSTNYFYANTVNCSLNLDLIVSGNSPQYSFGPVNFSGNNLTGTGIIYNTGISDFRFYSGDETISGLFSTVLMPTGDISSSGIYTVKRNFELQDTFQFSDNDTSFPFTFDTNFGQINNNIIVSTRFPIVQVLTSSDIYQMSGAGTGLGFLYWNNTKGQSGYSGALSGNLTINWLSGGFTGSFDNLFGMQTGNLDVTGFTDINYNSFLTGFSAGLNTYNQSGMSMRLYRKYYNSGVYTINLNYSGYNTGINYTILSY